MKRSFPLLLVATLWLSRATAQEVYGITEVQEFCLCWDGTQENMTYTFQCESVGCTVTLAFCSGSLDPSSNMIFWEGAIGGTPHGTTPSLTGDLSGWLVTSAGSMLSFSFNNSDVPAGFPICGDGITPPIRWVAYVDTGGVVPTCMGTEPFCPVTGVQSLGGAPTEWVRIVGDQLVFANEVRNADVDVYDTSGRLAAQIPVQGRSSVAFPNGLPNGVYTLQMSWNGQRSAARVLVAR